MYQISIFPENILAALDALAELGKALNQTQCSKDFKRKAVNVQPLADDTLTAKQEDLQKQEVQP